MSHLTKEEYKIITKIFNIIEKDLSNLLFEVMLFDKFMKNELLNQ